MATPTAPPGTSSRWTGRNASAGFFPTGTAAAATSPWTTSGRGSSVSDLEASREVCFQVLDRLEAHRHPDQPIADASGRARLGLEAPVRGGGGMRDGALHVAEV